MRLISAFICAFLSLLMQAQGFGEKLLINDNWAFHLGDLKYGGRESLDHSEWRQLDLPHDWSIEGQASPELASCTGYLPGGIAWYRKDLDIPADRTGKKVYVYFGGVYNNSEVFINGKWLGKRPNGYISFMYDLTPYVNFGGKNVIAVRVDHSDDADSRWYTGSGIYRDVHLVYANPVHLDLWGVHAVSNAKGDRATFTVETNIVNHSDASVLVSLFQELLDADGNVVASATMKKGRVESKQSFRQSFELRQAQLWSLKSPYLYTLKTSLKKSGKLIDETTTRIGVRTLSFDPDTGFALNGKALKFKGVCIHHDAGCLGAAVPKTVWKRRLTELKKLGCNAIRTSHNPQATDLYDLCDEMGFLVMDEAFDEWEYPKKKWLKGWNKGEPGFQGSASYFREWGKRDLADMIRRDRNHPSIIMWSIGNEVDYPNDPYSHPVLDEAGIGQIHVRGYKKSQPNAERLGEIASELVEVVKKHDASRPVTAALAGAVMSNHTAYPFVLDIVGYNYTESRYAIDHKTYPDRVLYGSENRRDYKAWLAVKDNDFIMGQFLWTGFDYLGEAGRWPSRGFTTGLIDLAGFPKPQAFFRKALWSEEESTYLGTYKKRRNEKNPSMHAPQVWNYRDGDMVRVVCYTNCQEAELLLNGKKIGKRKAVDAGNGMIFWDIPFEAGELKVLSYMDGEQKGSDKIETVGRPERIKAIADLKNCTAENKVTHIEISMVDEKNRLVPFADTELRFELSENLRLLGTENSSTNAAENFKDDKHRCKNGRLLLYVERVNPNKPAQIKISNPLFESIAINFKSSSNETD